jgi:hypothetical protein
VKTGTRIEPIEYHEIVLKAGEGRDLSHGEGWRVLYGELKARRYDASVHDYEKECSFDIIVPESGKSSSTLELLPVKKLIKGLRSASDNFCGNNHLRRVQRCHDQHNV